MKANEILLGSDLICEFLGARLITPGVWIFTEGVESQFPDKANGIEYDDLKFHKSFDWIQKVIDNICKSGDFRLEIHANKTSITCAFLGNTDRWHNFQISYASSLEHQKAIEVVFMACIQFIEWHNLKK